MSELTHRQRDAIRRLLVLGPRRSNPHYEQLMPMFVAALMDLAAGDEASVQAAINEADGLVKVIDSVLACDHR